MAKHKRVYREDIRTIRCPSADASYNTFWNGLSLFAISALNDVLLGVSLHIEIVGIYKAYAGIDSADVSLVNEKTITASSEDAKSLAFRQKLVSDIMSFRKAFKNDNGIDAIELHLEDSGIRVVYRYAGVEVNALPQGTQHASVSRSTERYHGERSGLDKPNKNQHAKGVRSFDPIQSGEGVSDPDDQEDSLPFGGGGASLVPVG